MTGVPTPLLGGTPNFIKRDKIMCANALYFSTYKWLCHLVQQFIMFDIPHKKTQGIRTFNTQIQIPWGEWLAPGGDLLDDLLVDLLTPCAGTHRTMALYIKLVTNSASWLYYISLALALVLGRKSITVV